MNREFKGNNVALGSIGITNGNANMPIITLKVYFTDDEGTVHGATNHEIALQQTEQPSMLGEIYTAAAALHQALRNYVEALHYRSPTEQETPVLHGIAESFRREDVTRDEPGPAG